MAHKNLYQQCGVLVGSDQHQEWLLEWWWSHYVQSNGWPVAFADFGMSERARAWCMERGVVISVERVAIREVAPQLRSVWQTRLDSDFWKQREGWFQKPLACAASPFEETCWIDLDCQVRGSLAPLWELEGLALAAESEAVQEKGRQQGLLLPGEVEWNSGVVRFQRGDRRICEWVERARSDNHCYLGDQSILSRVVFLDSLPVTRLDPKYNWSIHLGPNPEAVIIHFAHSAKLLILAGLYPELAPIIGVDLELARRLTQLKSIIIS
jgi:hypothetical protein